MKTYRYSHTTATLENGNVLIMGGHTHGKYILKDIELFIP